MLDADLARIYGVTTKQFNQALKRNLDRFPEDFAFRLSLEEFALLAGEKGNRSQFVTGSQKHRSAGYLPWAFTEHGALMAANIFRSERAAEMSVFIIRAFVKLREHTAANQAILQRLAEIDSTLLIHDHQLREIVQIIMPLLQPPEPPPKRKIGFRTEGEQEGASRTASKKLA
ncbi:MAG TPA: ORF6N domain-containing protein [Candidatus Kapabacteria bacterium]|nr:ORF6N domain-containing protein [Candidatus Kapabacteria bacterium]